MRTDIHCPSQIIPSDYEYVAVWTMNIQGLGDAIFIQRERELVKIHMERTGGTYSAHEHGGSCDVCGNWLAIYLVLFYHTKTNQYIRVGVNCAQKLEMNIDMKSIQGFKKLCADAREQQAGKRKAIALLSDRNILDAWEVYEAKPAQHAETCQLITGHLSGHAQEQFYGVKCTCGTIDLFNEFPERTIRDIVGKLVRYGSISDAQTSFVAKLLKQIVDRPIVEAQRQAEKDAAGPVPVGRVQMTGTVVGTKTVEDRFASRYSSGEKTMLIIKLENGSKVYGSCFNSLKRGDAVTFVATVHASDNDPKFGFYKRPKAVA